MKGLDRRAFRELETDTAGFTAAAAEAFGQHKVTPIGERQSRYWPNADDRLARAPFLHARAEFEAPLEIECGRVDVIGLSNQARERSPGAVDPVMRS
jgi:hypothetical protein